MSHFWIPGKSFGPYVFGASIKPFLESGELTIHRQNNATEVIYKSDDESVYIFVEEEKIDSVRVENEFCYKSKNLIGLSEAEAAESVDGPLTYGDGVIHADDSVLYPLEWDDLGLILWVEEDRVLYAVCYPPE